MIPGIATNEMPSPRNLRRLRCTRFKAAALLKWRRSRRLGIVVQVGVPEEDDLYRRAGLAQRFSGHAPAPVVVQGSPGYALPVASLAAAAGYKSLPSCPRTRSNLNTSQCRDLRRFPGPESSRVSGAFHNMAAFWRGRCAPGAPPPPPCRVLIPPIWLTPPGGSARADRRVSQCIRQRPCPWAHGVRSARCRALGAPARRDNALRRRHTPDGTMAPRRKSVYSWAPARPHWPRALLTRAASPGCRARPLPSHRGSRRCAPRRASGDPG